MRGSFVVFHRWALFRYPLARWTRRIMEQVCMQSQGVLVTYARSGPITSQRAMLSRRLSRRGFTMIELMVAIGILIILVGILMFAMRSIGDSAKAAETRATLASLSGMLAEMDAKTKLSQPPIQYWQPGNSTPVDGQVALAADSEVDFWHMPGKDTTGTYP